MREKICEGSKLSLDKGLTILDNSFKTARWKLNLTEAVALGEFCKKYVLTNFAKFTEKHLCWSEFFRSCRAKGLKLY